METKYIEFKQIIVKIKQPILATLITAILTPR